MAQYIPYNDTAFLAWMNNFLSVLNANLATFGLTAADLTPLTNARNDFQTKLSNFQAAETAYRAASEAKKTARLAAEPLFRQMAQRVNRHPAMTNELRAQLGLTVPKPRQRRGVGPEVPGVRLEVDAGRVVIHFGTNPDDERLNGKPAWALGANIYIKAADEAEYRLLALRMFGKQGAATAPVFPRPCPSIPNHAREAHFRIPPLTNAHQMGYNRG